MKRKMVVVVAALLLLTAVVYPIAEARAAMTEALGSCFLSVSGKSVTFGGTTTSAAEQDLIAVTAILWEKRGGTWYEVTRVSKTKYDSDYVSATKTCTVTGGYYYKVTATHSTRKGNSSSSSSSSTAQRWIPQ